MLRLSLVRRLLEEGSGDSNQGSGSRGTVPEIQTQLPALRNNSRLLRQTPRLGSFAGLNRTSANPRANFACLCQPFCRVLPADHLLGMCDKQASTASDAVEQRNAREEIVMSQSKVSQANFIDMVQAVSAKRIETARKRLSEAYEARASIEREKDPSNHKIHDS